MSNLEWIIPVKNLNFVPEFCDFDLSEYCKAYVWSYG